MQREAHFMARNFLMRMSRKEPGNEEAERFTPMFLEEAKKSIQANYLLEAVAKKENLEVTDQEVEERINSDAERSGMHPDKYKARFGDTVTEATKRQLTLDKALDFLVKNAVIKAEAPAKATE